jgi:hypothetical protein
MDIMDIDASEECLICRDRLDNDPQDSGTPFYVGPGNTMLNSLVGNERIQCLGEQHHKYHVKCFNSFVASQLRDPKKYALCMICFEGMDINDRNKAKLIDDIVRIGDEKKNEKLRYADALKTAKKDKDVLTETWIKLNNEKKYRGKLDWTIVKKRLVDKFYDKYYSDFSKILRIWLELHRDYDPAMKKARGERETALAQIRGVDDAFTDVGNELNLLIYYINDLTWDPISRKYINDNENGYGYHQYALPEDYIKDFEDTGLISGDITDETLESIIDVLIDKRHAELEEKPEYTGNVGYFPPSDLNYLYTEAGVFDHKYNARTSAMSVGGGSKPKNRYSRSKKMTMKRRINKGLGKSKKLRKKHILKKSNVNKK